MTDRDRLELFSRSGLSPEFVWHCEPVKWCVDAARCCLRVEPNSGTDFWQKTHYGFETDNGHFLHTEVAGNFDLSTRVSFAPVHQYDQAGLMVRVSSSCWLKTSVEYEPHGPSRLGAVVTNYGYSDWSTQDFPAGLQEVWFRVRRRGSDYFVEASRDGGDWQQLRLTHLHEERADAVVACGLYACSPNGAGYVAEFSFLTIDAG